ncbi:hypothetical protein [Micromonospora sp. NPDC005203]|uniref:hypothetical protein n=1 Tax=Micromonospora sp. NPDC005203 TaxID=3364226 RepID=UPI00367FC142
MTSPPSPRRQPIGRRAVLVAAGLAVGLPAAMVAVIALAGQETSPGGLLKIFLFALVFGVLGAAVALLASHRLPAPRTASPAARQALRVGHTDDPRVDTLARREAERRRGRRWVLWILGAAVLVEALLAVGATRPSSRVFAVVLGVFWAALGWKRWRDLRDADRYLANHRTT